MAKTTNDIQELLSTDLFRKGIAKSYISISSDNNYISYNCKNRTRRKLTNPEEFIQATAFLKLIFEYNYLPNNISVNENIQMGASAKEADILVYKESNSKIIIVVECNEDEINERQFQVAVDQAYSYAHALAAKYIYTYCLQPAIRRRGIIKEQCHYIDPEFKTSMPNFWITVQI